MVMVRRRERCGNNAAVIALIAMLTIFGFIVSKVTQLVVSRKNLADCAYSLSEGITSSFLEATGYMSAAPVSTVTTTPLASSDKSSVVDPYPLGVSASGNWKLWDIMTEAEQTDALERVSHFVKKYGAMLGEPGTRFHHSCGPTQKFGNEGGAHMMCEPPPPKPCFFLSSGINDDPSFDIALANAWGCRGIGLDPTIDHKSHLHPLVTFHNIGSNTVGANDEKKRRPQDEWWYSSVPGILKFFKMDYLDVVKLDCEGCELAFTRDILAEDPNFLSKVGQISLETHVSKAWINTTEQLYYFSLLFPLLEEAGFKLIWSVVSYCGLRHEKYGCREELLEWGLSCGIKRSCHDMLWARDDRRGVQQQHGSQNHTHH